MSGLDSPELLMALKQRCCILSASVFIITDGFHHHCVRSTKLFCSEVTKALLLRDPEFIKLAEYLVSQWGAPIMNGVAYKVQYALDPCSLLSLYSCFSSRKPSPWRSLLPWLWTPFRSKRSLTHKHGHALFCWHSFSSFPRLFTSQWHFCQLDTALALPCEPFQTTHCLLVINSLVLWVVSLQVPVPGREWECALHRWELQVGSDNHTILYNTVHNLLSVMLFFAGDFRLTLDEVKHLAPLHVDGRYM